MTKIAIKRIYEPPSRGDGTRILVDRLWPRGVSKEDAKIDAWAKDVAPSHELRRWFGHDEKKFNQFRARYFAELDESGAADRILSLKAQKITLLYAARNEKINHAVCLRDYIADAAGAE